MFASNNSTGQITLNRSVNQLQIPEAAPQVPIDVIEGESVMFSCQAFPTLQHRSPGASSFGTDPLPPKLRVIDDLTFEYENVSRSDNGFAFQCRSGGGFTDIGVINVLCKL